MSRYSRNRERSNIPQSGTPRSPSRPDHDQTRHDHTSFGPAPGPYYSQIELNDLGGDLNDEQIAELDRDLSAAAEGNRADQSNAPVHSRPAGTNTNNDVHPQDPFTSITRSPQPLGALGAKRISVEVHSLPYDPAVLKFRLKGALDALAASHKASAEVRDKNTRLMDEKRALQEEVAARRRAQAEMARELEKLRKERAEWGSMGYGKQTLMEKNTDGCEDSGEGAREGAANLSLMRFVLK
jgi:hypothetical protein